MTAKEVKERLKLIFQDVHPVERIDKVTDLIQEYLAWVAEKDVIYTNPSEVKAIAQVLNTPVRKLFEE